MFNFLKIKIMKYFTQEEEHEVAAVPILLLMAASAAPAYFHFQNRSVI
jgi:hypothetical protein